MNQKERPSSLLTKFVFFPCFYSYDVVFINQKKFTFTYFVTYLLTKSIQADVVKRLPQISPKLRLESS